MFCPFTFLRKQVLTNKHKKSLEELVKQFLWCFWIKHVLEFIVLYANLMRWFLCVKSIFECMYGGRRDWCMKLGGYRSSCSYRAKEQCFKAWLFLKLLDSGEDSQSAEARSQAWREKRREKRGPGCFLTSWCLLTSPDYDPSLDHHFLAVCKLQNVGTTCAKEARGC